MNSQNEEYKKLQKHVTEITELAILGKIALDIIHEINNPLQVMLGFTQDMLETMPEGTEYRTTLALIEEEILRCSQILKNIRILGGNYGGRSHQDLDLLVENLLPLLNLSLKKKKLSIVKTTISEIGLIVEETQKLKIILLCLLLTAIDHSLENNKIYFAAKEDSQFITVVVKFYPDKEQKNSSLWETYLEKSAFHFECFSEDNFFNYLVKFQKQKQS